MTKTELATKNRIRKRSEQALRMIGDIRRLADIIYDCAGEADMCIVSHIKHDLSLVESGFERLKSRNTI